MVPEDTKQSVVDKSIHETKKIRSSVYIYIVVAILKLQARVYTNCVMDSFVNRVYITFRYQLLKTLTLNICYTVNCHTRHISLASRFRNALHGRFTINYTTYFSQNQDYDYMFLTLSLTEPHPRHVFTCVYLPNNYL